MLHNPTKEQIEEQIKDLMKDPKRKILDDISYSSASFCWQIIKVKLREAEEELQELKDEMEDAALERNFYDY